MATPALLLLDDRPVNNSEWRNHGATGKSLEPEPKGEGTVWQRILIRPNRTHQNLTTPDEAEPRTPARLDWAYIRSDDKPRFMLCMAGLFASRPDDFRFSPPKIRASQTCYASRMAKKITL